MKKSKIIVPALGIIALSTAASITGTVAWFTASKSATITAGNFAVTKTTNNLEVALTAGIGTTAPTNASISVDAKNSLTDASFDHVNKVIYTPDSEGKSIPSEGGSTTLSNAVSNPEATPIRRAYDSESGKKVYSIMTWDMTLTVSFGSVPGDLGLFLKTSGTGASKMERADTYETDTATAKGFRMAFVPNNSANAVARVWAGLQTSSGANACKYVNRTSATDTTEPVSRAIDGVEYQKYTEGAPEYSKDSSPVSYAYKDLVDASFSVDLPADSTITQANAAKRADYLGYFDQVDNSRVSLSYTVVCWFEGTDPEIVNRTSAELYQKVKSTITLETVKLA